MKKSIGPVKFNRRGASLGVIGGAMVTVGLPWIILAYGQHLHVAIQTTVIILSLLIGGVTVLVAAFFGAVMPSSVGGVEKSSDDDEWPHGNADPD